MANPSQESKIIPVIDPGTRVDNAAFTSKVIDKLSLDGANYLEFIGHIGATDVEASICRVMESDELTDATTLGGTPTEVVDATMKPSATADGSAFVFGIDLSASRKRYIQLQVTAGDGTDGTFLSALAIASRPMEASSEAAKRGLLFAQYV